MFEAFSLRDRLEGNRSDMRECRKWFSWRMTGEWNFFSPETESAFHKLLADTRVSGLADLESPAFREEIWSTTRDVARSIFLSDIQQ
jgi:hypothetical protein